MMRRSFIALTLALLATVALADLYVHNPRGSNNRLNERSANRNNGNRLFDSQNNNRGGYNVGDKTDVASTSVGAPSETFNYEGNSGMQYQMMYFEGSELSIEWTNQHGCGGHEGTDSHKTNCDLILQYMCDTDNTEVTDMGMQVRLRDGANTNTPNNPSTPGFTTASTGRHESEAYYLECKTRDRNKGLFTADQKLKGDAAIYTRQNPGGTRRGLECPEERDYYPYWHPSPWRDIAILTDHDEDCDWLVANSQNTKTVYKCTGPSGGGWNANMMAAYEPNNEEDCNAVDGATWTAFTKNLPAPDCQAAPWSRVNHLGNGRDGRANKYNWTLPTIAQLGSDIWTDATTGMARCVFRMRYNISTDDYDPKNTNASHNQNLAKGIRSPVEQNPTVDVGAENQGLRLAINTAQFGRTFQDRSHVFYIAPRPSRFANSKMINLNVRGKRGNIVQTFPSVEYDFIPNRMHVDSGDLIHVQWTGSNTHNNGNPAGDGQAGDAGEGTGGTDRHNMVPAAIESENFPMPIDKTTYKGQAITTFLDDFNCWTHAGTALDKTECALALASSGYYRNIGDTENRNEVDPLLNNAPASLVGGIVLSPKTAARGKSYHYLCTRNNNFSNRSQKGSIVVDN